MTMTLLGIFRNSVLQASPVKLLQVEVIMSRTLRYGESKTDESCKQSSQGFSRLCIQESVLHIPYIILLIYLGTHSITWKNTLSIKTLYLTQIRIISTAKHLLPCFEILVVVQTFLRFKLFSRQARRYKLSLSLPNLPNIPQVVVCLDSVPN